MKGEVDLEIRTTDAELNDVVYSGKQERSRLHALMTAFEDVLFHNGFYDLIVKSPDSAESITFDGHGLIYINTTADYADVLANLGAVCKSKVRLISKYFHWHHSSEDLNARLLEFVGSLGLIKTFVGEA